MKRRLAIYWKTGLTFSLLFFLLLAETAWAAEKEPAWFEGARQTVTQLMTDIGAAKGDDSLLVLTNAGYGQIEGGTTELFLDLAQELTGCSIGRHSLLAIHKSINDGMWFSLYNKNSEKIAYACWQKGGFSSQVIDATAEKLLAPEGWTKASAGLMKGNMFSVVSLSLTWAANPPWTLLLAGTFHDHFCPGVNAGYYFGKYLQHHFPLGSGEKYVFVNAPGICPADALQLMFNATAGKSSMYARAVDRGSLGAYSVNGVTPSSIVFRVNGAKNSSEGLILGFDWNRAYELTKVPGTELAPAGGMKNPLFFISRVKMARALAALPEEKAIELVVVLKSFSGEASLVNEVGGGDPYARFY